MGYNLMFGGFHPGDFSKQKPLTNSTLSMAFIIIFYYKQLSFLILYYR